MKAIVADRGQVTIPKELRESLGITPHTILEFHEENGRMIVEKAEPTNPFEQVRGCLKLDVSTDEFIAEIRGRR